MGKQASGRPKMWKIMCSFFPMKKIRMYASIATHPRVYVGNPLSGSSLLWVGTNGIESILPRSALAIGFGSYCRWPKQGGSAADVVDGTKQAGCRRLFAVENDSSESSVPKLKGLGYCFRSYKSGWLAVGFAEPTDSTHHRELKAVAGERGGSG